MLPPCCPETEGRLLLCAYAAVLVWTAAAQDPDAEAERLASANPKAFQGVKRDYDRSKATYTRTDYEVCARESCKSGGAAIEYAAYTCSNPRLETGMSTEQVLEAYMCFYPC